MTAAIVGMLALLALVAAGLAWAKWDPYVHKTSALTRTHVWPGSSFLAVSGTAGAAPTLAGAWRFATSYFSEVWEGFLVFFVAAAAMETIVLERWLLTVMKRRTWWGRTLAAGAAGLPSMMCTCCSAPMVVSLRRRGVPTSSALAYWAANPVLNPAVIAFLFLVAPWQFGAVRIVVGVVLVMFASAAVGAVAGRDDKMSGGVDPAPDAGSERIQPRHLPRRFLRSLIRLAVTILPVYFAAVLVIGFVSGWLSDFGSFDARFGLAAVLLAAVVGTLLVLPTGGEVPVVTALAAAGLSVASAGALLITLPAISVPSILMVRRSLSWKATLAMAGAVTVCGVGAGALLWALMLG